AVFARPTAPGELQHLHPRQLEGVTEGAHARRDDAEIFGNDGQVAAERFAEDGEELEAGGGNPATDDGRRLAGGDFPIGFEAAKVIDSDNIDHLQGGVDAL